jgi:hypothetical protein
MNKIILLGRKEMKAVKRRKNMRQVKRKKFTRIYTEVKMKNAITDSSPCRKQKQKKRKEGKCDLPVKFGKWMVVRLKKIEKN